MTGIGLDVVEIPRFRAIVERRPAILLRLFSPAERALLAERHDPVPSYAARFAAKEAVMKALGVGIGAVDFADIEVLRTSTGAPELKLGGRAAILAEKRNVKDLHVSLSHSATIAQAIVALS